MTHGKREPDGEREVVEVVDLAGLRHWLEEHHDTSPGVWIVTGKKGSDTYVA